MDGIVCGSVTVIGCFVSLKKGFEVWICSHINLNPARSWGDSKPSVCTANNDTKNLVCEFCT